LDGKPTETIDRQDVLITELSDGELYLIASCGRTEDDLEMKLIPPMPLKD
jgi:hypothetical protein